MIYEVNPVLDRRWENFVATHPNSSIFHTPGWLLALHRTYGYEPVVYTTSPPQGELTNGLVFCRISSWITGRRLVSLPFSDHCDPLTGDGNSDSIVLEELRKEQRSQDWKYIEVRSRMGVLDQQSDEGSDSSFCFHTIDLTCDEQALFLKFHKNSVRKMIQRAERENLQYVTGSSNDLLEAFYKLYVRNRRRKHIPPQPFRWFKNLSKCLGPAMQVRVAFKGNRLAAGIVTFKFRKTLVYKYGTSDPQFNRLGGTPSLLWGAIREAKAMGLQELDLGRSDWDNRGLITFKNRLGGKQSVLSYWRYPNAAAQSGLLETFKRPAGWAMGHAPLPVLIAAGSLLYRHIG
jgi:CelD/BcsL family acetyltransferase involved in cellulose biosynthesis